MKELIQEWNFANGEKKVTDLLIFLQVLKEFIKRNGKVGRVFLGRNL